MGGICKSLKKLKPDPNPDEESALLLKLKLEKAMVRVTIL
jgi:hypothetical protein